ncbi:YihY/virulence factor BrkB family protein [Pontibacter sp. BT310]|jgi:membrane protein|uniref:YihY/virulence factor BrkB family protein n=1 Tax=Pontibacter populi TaxID=890055 RepID=A0ABS6XBC6_9BACT|nr:MULTISPECIES: YihY/virulence factor BrkB family protein [Pontibacter]MBJ6118439.1 YihY/virulence factor BrkB family protein [Pontibacter sp. BT310]MBR0570867.1 YihY/virulence factor BrkB family protein [Microvirga sp. STS03]MBW3365293.1 YihY/virulence factor BrkB family protein [Pontibacter populi]
MNKRVASIWEITKQTFKEFVDDNPLDYAAIIGFYTIFSLPAVLIITIRIAGAAFGQEAVKGEVVKQLGGIVGQNSATQFQSIIENAALSDATTIGTIVGVATMIFSATTVFVALQDSLNAMWEVKAKIEKGWLKLLIGRVLSLAMVISMGFLLLVSLSIDVALGIVYEFLRNQFSGVAIYIITIGNLLVSLVISTVIFAAIYRVLPDAKIRWKNVWVGAIVTSVLFVLGKYVLNIYFQHEPLADTYGAAGSLVLILVWVYYTAVIFLFGAEFTQVYSKAHEKKIEPEDTAVKVKKKEVEIDTDTGKVEVKSKEKGDSL